MEIDRGWTRETKFSFGSHHSHRVMTTGCMYLPLYADVYLKSD